jgi:hypothetical protein
MRITLGVMTLALLAGSAAGQSMEEKYKEKLQKKFVSTVAWEKTLEEAQAKAAAEKKLIFGYFTRSYAP